MDATASDVVSNSIDDAAVDNHTFGKDAKASDVVSNSIDGAAVDGQVSSIQANAPAVSMDAATVDGGAGGTNGSSRNINFAAVLGVGSC